MIEKKIDLYADEFNSIDLNSSELICELNNQYAILLVSDKPHSKIFAYEYFELNTANDVWKNIFTDMKLLSRILMNHYNTSRIFYNPLETLVVPALYANEDNAKIYLNTFYNSLHSNTVATDKLSVFDDVSVIYAMEEDAKQEVVSTWSPTAVHHSYSMALQHIAQTQQETSQPYLHLFFYHQLFVPVLTIGSQLKFIKSVNYSSVNDVLYFALNVAKQYNTNMQQLQVKVLGFINADSQEFKTLQKYFANIVVEKSPVTTAFNNLVDEFSKQYFIPFFYLSA
jgi:hypothetical protein